MAKIKIKNTILFVFITLISIVSISIIYSNFQFSKKIAIESTTSYFKNISQNITSHIESENINLENILNILSFDEKIKIKITKTPYHPILKDLINILSVRVGLYSVYMMDTDGSFFELINIKNNNSIHKLFNVYEKAIWMVIEIIDNQEIYYILDKNLKILKQVTKPKTYYPSKKEWYKQAKLSDKMVVTTPYKFNFIDMDGITYSKKTSNGSVIAIDYTLDVIEKYFHSLKSLDGVEIFLLDHNLKYILSTAKEYQNLDIEDSLKNIILVDKFDKVIKYTQGDIPYYVMLTNAGIISKYIGVRIDSNKLLAPYIEKANYSIFIAFVLLFIFIPIIIYSTSKIVDPIKKLIDENEKIKKLNFSDVKKVDTKIFEFDELSTSLMSMSTSIQKYQKSEEELLNSIIKLIAQAIDAKSEYTAGHCERVPQISRMIMDELDKDNNKFKEFSFKDKNKIREFEIGAWLHDCGKVTTPEYVVDKATKLETIYNRIHEIRMRFEVLLRDEKIKMLEGDISKDVYENEVDLLIKDFYFIANINLGGEYLDNDKIDKIKTIGKREWVRYFSDRVGLSEGELLRYEGLEENLPVKEKLLDDKVEHITKREHFDYDDYKKRGFKLEVPKYLYNHGEIYNLCIKKGTLSAEERFKINEHVIMSIKMLEEIPFPDYFKNIPEYAGTHHETLIGTGYPRKLTKEQLSIGDRVMAIADIFEALSASDRPYKEAKTLSVTLKIMSKMVEDEHIDRDIFRVFVEKGIYKKYADIYLKPSQIDKVDLSKLNL